MVGENPVQQKMTKDTQETLIQKYAVLVKRIARKIASKLPSTVLLDDLLQAGMMGLLEAIKQYDREKGASFETYAGIRIRGYILDEVRQNDWVPRSVHKNARMISDVVRKLEHQLLRSAKDHEIAEALALSLEDYYELLKDAMQTSFLEFEEAGIGEGSIALHNRERLEPSNHVARDDIRAKLSDVLKTLPEREQMVLSLYYERDLNLKEIGAVFEIGESRVSQIMSQAILRIQSRIATHLS